MAKLAKIASCMTLLVSACWAQNSPPPSTTEDLLTRGKQLYTQEGPKTALPPFEEALKQFRTNHDRHGEAVVLGYIANCQRKLGNLDEALEFAQHSLRMKEELGDRGEQGNTHNQLGLIQWERADYPSAMQHLHLAIEIGASIGDEELQGAAHNNLGLVLDERGDYQHSLEQYQLALKLDRAAHFERGEGDALGNIGGVHLTLGRFREAFPFYQQALEISERLGLKPAASDDLGDHYCPVVAFSYRRNCV